MEKCVEKNTINSLQVFDFYHDQKQLLFLTCYSIAQAIYST